MQSITSEFGDKHDVVPKHWKLHIVEVRTDVLSELDCSGLAQLDGWHYTAYESPETCHLAKISKEISNNEDITGNNQKISINLNVLSDFKAETFTTRTSNLYAPYIYEKFSGAKNSEHCSIHCYFDADDKCDFHFIHDSKCYLGNFNTETAIGSTSGSHEMYIFKGNAKIL